MSTKRKKRIPKLENCNGSGRVYLCGRYPDIALLPKVQFTSPRGGDARATIPPT